MENVKQLAEEYIKLSNEERQEFVKRIRTHWPDWECDNFENPTTKVEHVKELQEKMGTQDWKIDEYEGRICRIFQQLGLDPATKDNRNWQDILGIEIK